MYHCFSEDRAKYSKIPLPQQQGPSPTRLRGRAGRHDRSKPVAHVGGYRIHLRVQEKVVLTLGVDLVVFRAAQETVVPLYGCFGHGGSRERPGAPGRAR